MAVNVSLQKLIESGAHFGHQTKRWNPKMEEYIYGAQEGVHVFDLMKTKAALEEALAVLKKASKDGKSILFLATKKQAREKVSDVALDSGCFYVSERWLGGTLTNFGQIKKSINKLSDLKSKMDSGFYSDRTKKEKLLITREIARLERFFGGIAGMDTIPDVIVIVDIKREKAAIKEALMKKVDTIGIVDTNSDPTLVDYPIPMNDDATRALDYVLELMGEAVKEGKKGKGRGKSKSNKS